MHFYYLDEVGCTGEDLSSLEQPIFVLGEISVRDEGWNATHDKLNRMLEEYFGGNIPPGFELHANELLSPEGEGPFAGHDRDRRNHVVKKVLHLIAERKHDVHLV